MYKKVKNDRERQIEFEVSKKKLINSEKYSTKKMILIMPWTNCELPTYWFLKVNKYYCSFFQIFVNANLLIINY